LFVLRNEIFLNGFVFNILQKKLEGIFIQRKNGAIVITVKVSLPKGIEQSSTKRFHGVQLSTPIACYQLK